MAFRLRYLAHDLALPLGRFVVGRGSDCELALDDPMVSRRHAELVVRTDGVTVRDLGSRNGVLVNDEPVEGERKLEDGDRILIGAQEMSIHASDDASLVARRREEMLTRTQTVSSGLKVSDVRAHAVARPTASLVEPDELTSESSNVSKTLQTFQVIGSVADKALALGRPEEAERVLTGLLADVMRRTKSGREVEREIVEFAGRYAARLAATTGKGAWFDYPFELFGALGRVAPAPIVDELYGAVRKVRSADLAIIRAYLAKIRASAEALGPAERFLLQRLEGLERLVALK